MTPAWWTAADDAELDILTFRLVEAGWAHRECARCRVLEAYCEPIREAVEAVLDWRRARNLLSRAEHLRALQAAT